MSDTSGVSGGSAPPPATRAEPPPSGRGAEAGRDPRTDAFRAALHEVDRGDAREDDEDGARNGDDARPGGARKRKAGEGGGLASLLGLKAPPHGLGGPVSLKETKEDADGALAGLGAYTGGSASAGPAAEAEGASPADLSAFTQMMEAAAVRAQAAAEGAPITVSLNDAGSMLESFQVSRSADGSLNFTLQAAPGSAEEVSRSLDTLRRRLEARGLSLGGLQMSADGPGPQAVQAAEAG